MEGCQKKKAEGTFRTEVSQRGYLHPGSLPGVCPASFKETRLWRCSSVHALLNYCKKSIPQPALWQHKSLPPCPTSRKPGEPASPSLCTVRPFPLHGKPAIFPPQLMFSRRGQSCFFPPGLPPMVLAQLLRDSDKTRAQSHN